MGKSAKIQCKRKQCTNEREKKLVQWGEREVRRAEAVSRLQESVLAAALDQVCMHAWMDRSMQGLRTGDR
jgi:hypothetical protein